MVNHAPPSALRKYDAILLDECSQIDNATGRKVVYAIDELPQRPFVAIAADYKQIQPVGNAGYMARVCRGLTTVTLNTIYRTDDAELLQFQSIARESQPDREILFELFRGRRWPCRHQDSLLDAVQSGLDLEKAAGEPFVWLCVVNKGVRLVN